jgi:hypothetical protein
MTLTSAPRETRYAAKESIRTAPMELLGAKKKAMTNTFIAHPFHRPAAPSSLITAREIGISAAPLECILSAIVTTVQSSHPLRTSGLRPRRHEPGKNER